MSLKAVLMYEDHSYKSIPIAHGIGMKEYYENIKFLLDSIKYHKYKWYVCGDFKMISFLRGLQAGYPKYCCFLCLWDSRDYKMHYRKHDWPKRTEDKLGAHSIHKPNLVEPRLIMMPSLHIKLGIFKQFIKTLKDGPALEHLKIMFPNLTVSKIEQGVFTGPQIHKVLDSPIFVRKLTWNHAIAFDSMKKVFNGFLGLDRNPGAETDIALMIKNFERIKANMSLKMHMLHSHSDFFKHSIRVNDQHGQRFHQDILPMENRYKGKWTVNMIGDYIWSILADDDLGSD